MILAFYMGIKKRQWENNEEEDIAPEPKEIRLAINGLDLGVTDEQVIHVIEGEVGYSGVAEAIQKYKQEHQ